jgi:hypothetical protein
MFPSFRPSCSVCCAHRLHDYREEHGERVHAYTCRRCEIALRLKNFRAKIRRFLHDVDFDVGDPEPENEKKADSASRENPWKG